MRILHSAILDLRFAMYAKLDKYYTLQISNITIRSFAMYAKLDKYYTL